MPLLDPDNNVPTIQSPPEWIYSFDWAKYGTNTVDVIRYWQAGGDLDQLRAAAAAPTGLNLFDPKGGATAADLAKIFGGAGSSGPSTRDIYESLMGQLKSGAWALPFDVTKIVRAVAGKKGDFSMVLNRILSDSRFKKAFPGIFNKDGTLKMTPAEYRDRAQQYKTLAAEFGFAPNSAQIGNLVSGNVSPEEAKFRFEAGQTLRNNAAVLQQFQAQINDINDQRRADGKPPLPNLTNVKDAFNFITKQASPTLYATYEAASIGAAAKAAGLDIGTAKARRLAGAGAGITSMDQAEQSFKEIAEQLRTAGVELSAFGISQDDLETIQFGGAGRAEKAARAERALRQQQAQSQTEIQGEELQKVGGRPVAAEGAAKAGA